MVKLLLCAFTILFSCVACDIKSSKSTTEQGIDKKSTKAENSSSDATTLQRELRDAPLGPTAIAGVSPGKTTLEDLKSLIKTSSTGGYTPADEITPDRLDKNFQKYANGQYSAELKDLSGKIVSLFLNNGVVYKVSISTSLEGDAIKAALFEKYGKPTIKTGSMKNIICTNGFGASFQRSEGEVSLQWKSNEGVQAYLHSSSGNCQSNVYESYVIEDIATVKNLATAESAQKTKSQTEESEKVKQGL